MALKAQTFKAYVKNFAQGSREKKAVAYLQVQSVLKNQEVIRSLIENARLSGKVKNRFKKWFRLFFKSLNDLDEELLTINTSSSTFGENISR